MAELVSSVEYTSSENVISTASTLSLITQDPTVLSPKTLVRMGKEPWEMLYVLFMPLKHHGEPSSLYPEFPNQIGELSFLFPEFLNKVGKLSFFNPVGELSSLYQERLLACSLSQASKSTQFCPTMMFLLFYIFSCNLSKFLAGFSFLCICWDTPSDDTGL